MHTVEVRAWRERRDNGWSETRYEGLFLRLDSEDVLVSKLSHGLRAFVMDDEDKYNFDQVPGRSIKISSRFYYAIKSAFAADLQFQEMIPNYERTIASSVEP